MTLSEHNESKYIYNLGLMYLLGQGVTANYIEANILIEKAASHKYKPFLYITHDIATARYFSERIIVLYCGHMVEWGDVNKVVQDPKHPYTQLLISAAPDPERERVAELKEKGRAEIQQWTPENKGCPFAPRCLKATEICLERFPEAVEVDEERFVRCNHL